MTVVVTHDDDRVLLCSELPGPQFIVVHAMLDRGDICPPDPALHARDYARYFPALSEEVEHKGLVLSGPPCEAVLTRGTVASVAVCLSVPFTPTILSLEQYDADFFPHYRFSPRAFAQNAQALVA